MRLEFDNPGVRLKPGMFATVYIEYRRMDDVLAVPTHAILHSGRQQLVFVAHGNGRFEPREITTGLHGDHRLVEVTGGLVAGEQVVTSSQFLIDSESQLQEALQKILASSRGDEVADEQGTSTTVWSCPMHPDVIRPTVQAAVPSATCSSRRSAARPAPPMTMASTAMTMASRPTTRTIRPRLQR